MHAIWHEPRRWKSAITHTINSKVGQDKSEEPESLLGSLWKVAQPFIYGEDKVDEKVVQSTAFLILTQYNYYLLNLELDLEYSLQIIGQVASSFEIKSD